MDIKQAISKVVQHLDLDQDEMVSVMKQIMTGEATQAQIGAFLMGLRMKSESIDEITGATLVMRELASKVVVKGDHLVDIVGTGGDGANLFNVSTASAFVAAAAGAQVAKHGNRGVSSSTGSADLLQAAGVNIELNAEQVARCVEEVGIGFMFAPMHHAAMKYAVGPRKELGIRTFMNILGPMTNPAGVPNQVIGVFTRELCRPMAEVLNRLGSNHVLVVHSRDGLDEISIASETYVAELKDGQVTEYTINPEVLGIKSESLIGLAVEDSAGSLALIRDALGKREGESADKAANMIALNAGAAIYAANVTATLKQGVEMAQDAILTGLALEKLQELASFSQVYREV
ncbi:anthranilate phosphoribosyltransferase [Kistimonas scapharcae]|uniref:Anthranilate phosphoribosyltransferase n=1 Tax=Kistimonas scapharcae TaxID=1036133 RepID=A0ABP8V536_9GAMM